MSSLLRLSRSFVDLDVARALGFGDVASEKLTQCVMDFAYFEYL